MEVKLPFHFSPTISLSTPRKSLKVGQSDPAVRPRFQNGIDAFSTPSSTPETPASWPPRPALTCLGPTCLADHSCHLVFGNWQASYFVKAIRFYTGAIPFLNFLMPPVHFQKPPVIFKCPGSCLKTGVFLCKTPKHFLKSPHLQWKTLYFENVLTGLNIKAVYKTIKRRQSCKISISKNEW